MHQPTVLIKIAILLTFLLSPVSGSSDSGKSEIPPEQSDARIQVKELTTTQKSKLLVFLNEADEEALSVVRGISDRRGAAIKKARPFDSVDEVVLVKGIGENTFSEIIEHGKTLTRSRSSSRSSSTSRTKS